MRKYRPEFYIIGTKYGRTEDVLPMMLQHQVVSTGFAANIDLSDLIGLDRKVVMPELDKRVPPGEREAKSALAKFLELKPGDVIALKAHSAPAGTQARLVIARYAVVSGDSLPSYRRIEGLGHTVSVDFLAEQEPIEFPYGYGKTIHRLTNEKHIGNIFQTYRPAAELGSTDWARGTGHSDKSTYETHVKSRGSYIMSRTHNELQNTLRKTLEAIHGIANVAQEHKFIDLMVSSEDETILIEVKSSPSPTTCIREALGQLLHYASQLPQRENSLSFVVAGPSNPGPEDLSYIEYIRKATRLSLSYCTPSTYVPPAESVA